VVTAPACTYRETVTIGKPLTLRGYGATISGKDTAGTTARAAWVIVNASDVTVEGFAMRDANNAAQTGAVRVKAGISRFTLRACDLAYAAGANVSIGVANSSVIEDCAIHHGGQLGVHVGGDGTNGQNNALRNNRIYANNTAGFDPGWEAGGLKATVQTGLVMEGNEVYDNAGPGLWCDINCRNIVVRDNRVHDNSRAGIFFEISDGATITGNAVWRNGFGFTPWGWGAGILVSSSSNANVYGNTVAWNADGIDVISQNRGAAWNAVTGNSVHDNTIVLSPKAGDSSDKIALGWLQDWAGVMFNASANNRGANNAYWIGAPEPEWGRFGWNGPIDTLAALNATPGEEAGRYLSTTERDQRLGAAGIPTAP
jgi:parallel beta-helix repeat protein